MTEEKNPEPTETAYPTGRGYGHDYMRGGEVLGGYGYSQREEYSLPRGVLIRKRNHENDPSEEPDDSA